LKISIRSLCESLLFQTSIPVVMHNFYHGLMSVQGPILSVFRFEI